MLTKRIFLLRCSFVLLLVLTLESLTISDGLTARRYNTNHGSSSSSIQSKLMHGSVPLKERQTRNRSDRIISRYARYRRSFEDDGGSSSEQEDGRSQQLSSDRPTQTMFDVVGPALEPPKPKIVVLGASGRIGRLVVQRLLETNDSQLTVVALVRNYDKAIQVLYDDLRYARAAGKSPKLQIVEADLVPPEELPGFGEDNYEDDEEESYWFKTAESAASFYGNNVEDYDNREYLPDVNEALEDAIKDCTAIISCVGSVRTTNLWTDILARPFWRLLRHDVSKWCKDPRHPYYTHYLSTRKALGYAEREQVRREAAAIASAEADDTNIEDIKVSRIRFVRISDLCVGHNPWEFVPIITNMFHSMVFRYQDMAEQLLDQSTMVETVVIRPGDLVDDERDVNTTALQVCANGIVDSPARVGREDVADLVVASTFFPTKNESTTIEDDIGPFHYTLGVRWVGNNMDPYPPQGRKMDGLPNANSCMKRVLKTIEKSEKRSKRRRKVLQNKRKTTTSTSEKTILISRLATSNLQQRYWYNRRRLKPYGIFVAIPVYMLLCLVAKTIGQPTLQYLPGGKTIILPTIHRFCTFLITLLSFLIRNVKSMFPSMKSMLPWLKPKQYISF